MTDYFSLKNTNVKVEFKVVGDNFSPDIITERLGVYPTVSWLKNEPIPNREKLLRKTCLWSLCVGYEESINIMIQIEQVIKKLAKVRETLVILKKEFDLNYYIDVFINIENGEKPAINLDYTTIKFLHDIEAEFRMDMCIFDNDE